MEVLRAYVRALQSIEQRNAGEPVPTPQLFVASTSAASGTLREAIEGWKKERERPEGTVHEYGRAIDMFIQLHGNLPILEIKRSHARTFREALQLVPKSRKGALLRATLPELSDYGRAHPTVQKVSPGTVNKQLGAVQAIAGWGRHNGLVPEDAPWTDPFNEMRLEEEQSQREPFDARDLQTIFNAPLFTEHKLPVGAKGAPGIWLPLLALFAGARQAEYAGLRVSDIREDGETRVPLMWFTRDVKAGRRLKTKSSERVVPLHRQLVKIGFLDYVAARQKEGEQARLFPTVAPDQ
jgi:integrase